MGNLSLDIGLRSLLTAQAGLETIGHNVANAGTAGYSRQDLLVSAAPGFRLRGLIMGRGVQADVVRRVGRRLDLLDEIDEGMLFVGGGLLLAFAIVVIVGTGGCVLLCRHLVTRGCGRLLRLLVVIVVSADGPQQDALDDGPRRPEHRADVYTS